MAKKDGNWFTRHKVVSIIGGVILLFFIIGIASGDNKQKTTNNPAPQPAVQQPAEKPKEWDPVAAYAKVENGMSKAQVEAATEKPSSNCIESAIEGLGTSEHCSYGGFSDKGQISVTYSNGKVSSKTKMNF